MKLGRRVYPAEDRWYKGVEISGIKAHTQTAFHLGYCECGRSIHANPEQCKYMLLALQDCGVETPRREQLGIRERLALRMIQFVMPSAEAQFQDLTNKTRQGIMEVENEH